MKAEFKEIILVGTVLFGSMVGAGFASGKEVWFYFAQFGWVCFPLIGLAGFLLFILGFLFLEFGKKYGVESVQSMNKHLYGKASIVAEVVFIFSNFILLAGMFAGSNSLFDIVLDTDIYRYAAVITALLSVLISWLGFEKMVKVNLLAVPAMVGIIAIAFMYCIGNFNELTIPPADSAGRILTAMFFCVLFVCSNLFFAGYIFARLGRVHSRKVNFLGSLTAAIFMVICLLGMVISIYLDPYSSMSDMPLVFITSGASSVFGIITLIVVWLGILTTAISLVYTISHWLQQYFKSYKFCSLLVAILALLLSGVGFGNIVSYCYPVMGCIGVLFIMQMYIVYRKSKKAERRLLNAKS